MFLTDRHHSSVSLFHSLPPTKPNSGVALMKSGRLPCNKMCISPYFNIVFLLFTSELRQLGQFFIFLTHHPIGTMAHRCAITIWAMNDTIQRLQPRKLSKLAWLHRRWAIVPIIMGSKKKIVPIVVVLSKKVP